MEKKALKLRSYSRVFFSLVDARNPRRARECRETRRNSEIMPSHNTMPLAFYSGSYFDFRDTLLWSCVFLFGFLVTTWAIPRIYQNNPARSKILGRILWSLLFLGVLARLTYPWIVGSRALVLDDGYYERAEGLYQGFGFAGAPHHHPTALEMPGYSLLLAATFFVFGGPSHNTALWLQIFLGLFLVAAVYVYAATVFDKLTGLLSACIVSLFPSQIVLSTFFQSDLAFEVSLWGGIAALACAARLSIQRRQSAKIALLVSGALLGLASLTRAYGLILVGVGLLWILIQERRALLPFQRQKGEIIIVLMVVLALHSIWVVRNFRVFHRLVPFTSSGGINLWVGNHPGASGKFDALPGEFFALQSPQGELALDDRLRKAAVGYLVKEPRAFLARIPKKWAFLFGSDTTMLGKVLSQLKGRDEISKNIFAGLANGYYLTFFLLAILFVLKRPELLSSNPMASVGCVFFAAFLAIFAVFHVETRFHIPLIPALSIYAGAFIRMRVE